ncbi:hypothetical protein B566_EDAN006357 [Ephemera danica]|nr:hypothetical protein B566_EDAN006357 [Ephemera danica]
MDFAAEKHFSKKFSFITPAPETGWKLPCVSTLFTGTPFQNSYLKILKCQLNKVKSQLNDYILDDWHRHTKATNPAGRILWTVKETCSPELLTQAWCKFYEIISTYDVVPQCDEFSSLHLCEAPGAFVTALNHFLHVRHSENVQWKWLASTMNPHFEGNPGTLMVADDRFISLTLDKWHFGQDNTGDILRTENSQALVTAANEKLGQKILLVTADGSIDCQEDPGEQENLVAQLLLCEAITALHALQKGGNLVLKGFTWYEGSSLCLLYLLACSFKELHAFKPGSSREGNSEVYIIAFGYHGQDYLAGYLPNLMEGYEKQHESDNLLFQEQSIPDSFISQVCQASALFYNSQVEAIQHNIELFDCGISNARRKRIGELRDHVARSYIDRCLLAPISEQHYIVGPSTLNKYPPVHLEARSGEHCHTDQSILRTALRTAGQLSRDNAIGVLLHYAVWDMHTSLSIPVATLPEPHQDSNFSVLAHRDLKDWLPELLSFLRILNVGDTLELRALSLLTCLHVGLVRLLAPCFSKVSLGSVSSFGACVQLQGFVSQDNDLENFLQEVLDLKLNDGQQLLSVTPIPELCRGELYKQVVEVNHYSIRLLALETLQLLQESPS